MLHQTVAGNRSWQQQLSATMAAGKAGLIRSTRATLEGSSYRASEMPKTQSEYCCFIANASNGLSNPCCFSGASGD